MRLAHQLYLGVTLLFLAALTGALMVSFLLTRQYVTTQLASHAEDAATSLAFTLAPPLQQGDVVHAATVVDAMFSRGYYLEIRVLDARGNELVKRRLPPNLEGVPSWFTASFNIELTSGESLISGGWRQLGRVIVKSHPGHAYLKLWEISGWLLLLFSATFILTSTFLWLVLRTILRPLRDIEQQALDIGKRVFREIADVPKVRELRTVVTALNRMAQKLRQSFDEQAILLEHSRREAREDGVTGLPNRREFEIGRASCRERVS
jgi:methyl-accepting chemotaxis protein